MLDHEAEWTVGRWILSVLVFVFYVSCLAAFNVVTWYFCYKYFRCGEKLKYVWMHKALPEKAEAFHKILFKTLLVFNILIPLLLGVLSYVRTLQIYF